jgi:hypothetical protein
MGKSMNAINQITGILKAMGGKSRNDHKKQWRNNYKSKRANY